MGHTLQIKEGSKVTILSLDNNLEIEIEASAVRKKFVTNKSTSYDSYNDNNNILAE
ncbi:7458_t:CDS:2, partial [Scutellospora calospora]